MSEGNTTNYMKFRVWNNRENRYARQMEFYTLYQDGEIVLREYVCGEMAIYRDDEIDVTVERCTGMEDKHGTLIYERDLVKREDGTVGVVRWFNSVSAFQVEYTNGLGEDSCYDLNPMLEIIGNTHNENSEQ